MFVDFAKLKSTRSLSLCMKHFRTDNMNTAKDCQAYFNLNLPSELLVKRHDKFLSKLSAINTIYDTAAFIVNFCAMSVYFLCCS